MNQTTTVVTTGPSMGYMLLSAVIGIIVGGIVWGLIIMLTSGPIGQKKLGAGPSFKTGFTIAIINNVLSFVLSFVPILLLLMLPISFLVAMFAIHKMNGIALGRSALMTLIGWIIMFLVGLVIVIIVGILAAIVLGTAAAH